MSDISTLLDNAKEKIHSAIALMQTNIPSACPFINKNYEWDGGDGLLAFDARGAGTEELSQSMAGLANLLGDLEGPPYEIPEDKQDIMEQYLEGIARARGITMEQALRDFDRFLGLMNEANNGEGIKIEPTDEYGTLSHLRFGFMVGEALDIDAAFASLMSAYGGLTGPGSWSLNIDGKGWGEKLLAAGLGFSNEALAYHSPTHDAFGFLKKNFDIGPGYCYVPDGECAINDGNNFSGQMSGITYWEDKRGVSSRLGTILEASGLDSEAVNEAVEGGREIWRETSEAGREIWGEIKDGDLGGATLEIVEGGLETSWEAFEGGLETGWEAAKGMIPGL